MAQIAVTGAGGQLGSELCRQLGAKSVALVRDNFNLESRDQVLQLLRELRPAAVINSAAYTRVDHAEKEPDRAWLVNSEAVGFLAEACRQLNCPLVQVSTDYVFGSDATRRVPYREEDQPGPLGVYAQSKLGGEREAARHKRHLIVRTCGLYGSGGPTSSANFVDTMLRLGRERKVLKVVGDQYCTPSYVPHVARAIGFLLESGAQGLYHVVNSGSTTWYDFAAEIFRQAHLEVQLDKITAAEYAAPAPRPCYSVLDTSKYGALGGPALPDWQVALGEYLQARKGRA